MNRKRCAICGHRIRIRNRDYDERCVSGRIEHISFIGETFVVHTEPVCRRWICNYVAMLQNEENYPEYAAEVLEGG